MNGTYLKFLGRGITVSSMAIVASISVNVVATIVLGTLAALLFILTLWEARD